MGKVLMMLEVSRKQDYIFSSRKLRENVARSAEIRAVTESAFFTEYAGSLYNEAENLVYTGGGHTVLQFRDKESAVAFACAVSSAVVRLYPEMELYLTQAPYLPEKTPGENLQCLTEKLERKKAVRMSSFHWQSIGVEKIDRETWKPQVESIDRSFPELLSAPDGYIFPNDFRDLTGKDNFIAVVHIDGNAMGKRVSALLQDGATDWDDSCARLRRFSEGIDRDFRSAFSETVIALLRCRPEIAAGRELPIRPVVLAGDDICFVTAGSIGLECARLFLEHLTKKTNEEDKKPYAACAGVALVHMKYPFHMAYDLSESLCSSAKRFGVAIDAEGGVSAMDWHIEFGQLKNSLGDIREDYITDDGNHLELRPVAVVVPDNSKKTVDPARNYDFFRSMCGALQGEYGKIARSKLKELRTALKQGQTETEYFLMDKRISELLDHIFTSKHRSDDERWARYRDMLSTGASIKNEAFVSLDGESEKRSLFFDALEMIDHFMPVEEVSES